MHYRHFEEYSSRVRLIYSACTLRDLCIIVLSTFFPFFPFLIFFWTFYMYLSDLLRKENAFVFINIVSVSIYWLTLFVQSVIDIFGIFRMVYSLLHAVCIYCCWVIIKHSYTRWRIHETLQQSYSRNFYFRFWKPSKNPIFSLRNALDTLLDTNWFLCRKNVV